MPSLSLAQQDDILDLYRITVAIYKLYRSMLELTAPSAETSNPLPLYICILRIVLAWYRVQGVLKTNNRLESVCGFDSDSLMKSTVLHCCGAHFNWFFLSESIGTQITYHLAHNWPAYIASSRETVCWGIPINDAKSEANWYAVINLRSHTPRHRKLSYWAVVDLVCPFTHLHNIIPLFLYWFHKLNMIYDGAIDN